MSSTSLAFEPGRTFDQGLLIVSWTLVTISIIIVGLRVCTKRGLTKQTLSSDDYLTVIALVSQRFDLGSWRHWLTG